MTISNAVLSALIASIYDCAIDAALWPGTLDAIRTELGFAQATLSVQAMPSGELLLNVASGIPEEWRARIGDYGSDIIALWGGAARIAGMPLYQPILLTNINPDVQAGTCTNPYYLEWRRPQGIIDTLSLGLSRDAATLASASLVRHRDQGAIGPAEQEAARLLAPHLSRAVTIGRLLEMRAVTAATFQTILEALSMPVLIANARMDLVHANAAGHALLDRGEPLGAHAGRVVASNSAVARALANAASQSIGADIAARDSAGPCALHVLPLRPEGKNDLLDHPAIAIFIASPASAWPNAGRTIAALFALTEAEARVCGQIVAGATVAQTAATLTVNVSTVRTHLLRVFQKTGTSRQADLVRLAAMLHLPSGVGA